MESRLLSVVRSFTSIINTLTLFFKLFQKFLMITQLIQGSKGIPIKFTNSSIVKRTIEVVSSPSGSGSGEANSIVQVLRHSDRVH